MNIDAKSIAIIKAKYWQNGWISTNDRFLSSEDSSYLNENGWVLGTVKKSHDQIVNEICEMSRVVSINACAAMLSGSLSSRRVQERSYLSSVIQAKNLPLHSHTENGECPICGLYKEETFDQDVMVFEKIMWGGVRLTDLTYIWLDLKLLNINSQPIQEINELENFVRELANDMSPLSASKFAATLKSIKGNKSEREVLCGILGICDILQHPDHPGFLHRYVERSEREEPNQHFLDLEWPYCWYNRKFGVNLLALDYLRSDEAKASGKSQN